MGIYFSHISILKTSWMTKISSWRKISLVCIHRYICNIIFDIWNNIRNNLSSHVNHIIEKCVVEQERICPYNENWICVSLVVNKKQSQYSYTHAILVSLKFTRHDPLKIYAMRGTALYTDIIFYNIFSTCVLWDPSSGLWCYVCYNEIPNWLVCINS